MDDGDTTVGLQAKPGEAPATRAAFSELEGDSAMWSKVDMCPTEMLQGESMTRS